MQNNIRILAQYATHLNRFSRFFFRASTLLLNVNSASSAAAPLEFSTIDDKEPSETSLTAAVVELS